MGNKLRGQITTEFDGEKINLTLSTNAICELEAVVDQQIHVFLERFEAVDTVRMKDLRLIFWALMLEERPKATLKDAGRLIDSLRGDHQRVMTDAIVAAFPEGDGEGGDRAEGDAGADAPGK